jgi:hypothetical protein
LTGGDDTAVDGVAEGVCSPKQAIAFASAAATLRGETMIGARFCSINFRFSSDKDVSTRKSEKIYCSFIQSFLHLCSRCIPEKHHVK